MLNEQTAGLKTTDPVRRLVVLVPLDEMNEFEFGHKIWEIARSHHADVTFLSIARDDDEYMRLQHRLNHIEAVCKDRKIQINRVVKYKAGWQKTLRQTVGPGDLIIFFEDQTLQYRIFWREPLKDWLGKNIDVPVTLLTVSSNGKSG
jgi:hypothetical protein